jgi:hypothetical protein
MRGPAFSLKFRLFFERTGSFGSELSQVAAKLVFCDHVMTEIVIFLQKDQ